MVKRNIKIIELDPLKKIVLEIMVDLGSSEALVSKTAWWQQINIVGFSKSEMAPGGHLGFWKIEKPTVFIRCHHAVLETRASEEPKSTIISRTIFFKGLKWNSSWPKLIFKELRTFLNNVVEICHRVHVLGWNRTFCDFSCEVIGF